MLTLIHSQGLTFIEGRLYVQKSPRSLIGTRLWVRVALSFHKLASYDCRLGGPRISQILCGIIPCLLLFTSKCNLIKLGKRLSPNIVRTDRMIAIE